MTVVPVGLVVEYLNFCRWFEDVNLELYIHFCCCIAQDLTEEGARAIESPTRATMPDLGPDGYKLGELMFTLQSVQSNLLRRHHLQHRLYPSVHVCLL